MKKLFLLLLAVLPVNFCFGHDYILFDQDYMECIIHEITDTEVRYALPDAPDSIMVVLKSDIRGVAFEDGALDDFRPAADAQPATQVQLPVTLGFLQGGPDQILRYNSKYMYRDRIITKEQVAMIMLTYDEDSYRKFVWGSRLRNAGGITFCAGAGAVFLALPLAFVIQGFVVVWWLSGVLAELVGGSIWLAGVVCQNASIEQFNTLNAFKSTYSLFNDRPASLGFSIDF